MNVFTTGISGQGGGANTNSATPSTQTTRGILKASRSVPVQTQAPRHAATNNNWTITTTTGKQYSIDNKQFNWIKNRYQSQMADTYGLDDADQLAKRNGQLSAAALKTYKNSNVDRKLAELGLPSEKNIEKYLSEYQAWHTGGMDQVFGQMNLPKNYWTNVKGWYKSDMQNAYENTAEDQQRKARGLMPEKWEAKYTDTEIDDELRARGLPPISEFKTYAGRWDNYQGIENFYANVALNETNLRLAGVKDDNTLYPYNGDEYTGHDLYVNAFFDELDKTNEDGSYVYAPIRSMFKNSTKPTTSAGTGDYAYDRGAAITAANKEAANEGDYANYTAFSYDDYKSRYDDLYNRYFANQVTGNGQLVSDAIAVKTREADAEATKDYFAGANKDPVAFSEQYVAEHPEATPGEMFLEMFRNGVAYDKVHKAMKSMQRDLSRTGGKNRAEDGVSGFDDISDAFTKAWAQYREESSKPDESYKQVEGANFTPNDVIGKIKTEHGDKPHGEWSEDEAMGLMKELDEMGVGKDVIMSAIEDEADLAQLAEYADKYFKGTPLAERSSDLLDDMHASMDDARKLAAEDNETIDKTASSIQGAIANMIDESDTGVDVDAVLSVIDSVSRAKYTNPIAVDLALEDLGFSLDGNFSGWAADVTANWSKDDIAKLMFNLGDTRTIADESEYNGSGINSMFGLKNWRAQDTTILRDTDFSLALEWAQQKITNGELTEWEAYNILAADGFQDEMEYYMPEKWRMAHFIENVAPGLWSQSKEEDRLLWDEMTTEQRAEASARMWEDLTDEQKAAMYGENWWTFDPNVYRTFGQALEQQFAAVLPGLAAEIIGTPLKVLDAIDAGITGRPEMRESTQNIMGVQQKLAQYGSVTDPVNGAKVAQTAADVAQEIGRMYFYGSIGGAIGSAFAGTSAGAAVMSGAASNSAVVRGASKMFMSMVRSSPFMASAFANNYAEVKALGASNSEATWFALITGISEGALEGFEFDELWGKALGQGNFAKQLALGKHTYLQNLGIVGKAWVSSAAVSGLGEFTEESIGYVLETFLKMRHSDTWGKGTDWNASDWLQQAMMGFITGALGGGIAAGSSFVKDGVNLSKALRDNPSLQAALPDVLAAEGIANTLPKATLDAYRKGGAKIMSASEFGQLELTLNSCLSTAKSQIDGFKENQAAEDLKLSNRLRELDGYASKARAIDTSNGKGAKELSNLVSSKLGVELDMSKPIAPQVKAAFQDAVNKAVNAHDSDIATARANTEAALQGSENELKNLQKQVQEHFAGLYLMNEHLHDILSDEMLDNLAKAYQNGAQYDPEEAAKQREEKASKLAEAEANETMAEAEEAAKTPEDAATKARELAYNRVYKDQEAGKAYAEGRRGENDSKLTRVEFAENERQNFQAKTTAKLRRVTLELAGLEAKDGMSAKEIFAEAKKAMTPEAAQKLDMYQKLSKALGLDMVIRDVVAGTSGYVHDGKLYVTLNGKQSMLRVAAHELTHYMKGHANEQYDALRNHLVSEVGQEQFDQLVADKAQEYGLDLNTENGRLEADDEVCAELCEKMLENKDALEKFAQSDLDAAKTLKQRLAKTLVAIKSAIKSIGTSDAETKADLIKQQDTIESWYKGLSDAIDNANKAGKSTATTEAETATVTDTTVESPQAPPVETNDDLFMGEESARREQLRSELEELAKRGTKVQDVTRQEVNDVLDRVILGDKSNYNKADYAQIRGMLAQLIPEVTAYVNGDASVDANVLNERLSAALDYMLDKYSEGSEDYYGLRDLIPSKIALTDTAYKDLRAKDMTLRQASNELTKALGGKFVNFVYKKAPSYNNAMTIDELWQTITDQYGEQNGVGNIGEDALALIDYVRERADNRTSFNDLYGSQREDMVSSQVGEFLDAVQDMMNNKTEDVEARHLLDEGYVPGELDEEAIDEAFIEDVDESYFENEINRLLGMRPVADEAAPVVYDTSVDAQGNKLSDEQVDYFQGSQVRSKDGQLRPVYHYTNGTFTEFKPMPASEHSNRTLGDGYYVSVLPTEYQAFGKNRMVMYANITNPFEMELTPEQAAYVYDKYAAPFHEDKFGLYREHAIDSLQRFTKSMDYLREYADANGIGTSDILKDLGFDGIHDGPDWVAFDSNQLKFTDNKTPTTSNDLRFAVDDDLVQQYGAIEQGREPRSRDVQVPKQTNDTNRVSHWIRSLVESGKLTDDQAQNVMRMVVEQDYGTYVPTSQAERMEEARAYIAERQPLQAQQEFHDMVMQGKFGVKTNALGIQLLIDASARGDFASVLDIAADLQLAATEAGQSAQIFNVLKELKGVGSAWYMQKVIDRMNVKYADRIKSGKMQKITVDQDLMANLAKATTVDQMAAAEEAVAKDIARQLPLTWDDRLSSWRYFSMLANPTTHIRNITGNLLMKGLNTAKDITAIGVQRVAEKLGLASESDRAHAWLTSEDKSTWKNWVQQSYEEQARNLSGGSKLGFESFVKQNMRSFDTKWLNTLAQFNFKALEGEDIAFIRPAYKNALMQYMVAQGYTLNEKGQAGKVDAKGQFHEMSKAQMNEAIDWASQQAWKQTFRDASSLATMLNKLSKENAVSRLLVEGVMPFKKTPINIAKRGVDYSPAGIIKGIAQLTSGVKKGKVSTAQAIDTLSSGITGSALMALGVMLAKLGVIRAGGEKDKKLETYLEDTGDQTYAVKFGNKSINMSSIAPATIPLFMGVALNEMIEQGGDSLDLSTITDTIAGTLNPFMEMSFMSSLNSALKNYNNEGIGGALGSTIMTAAQNYGSQYLPTLGGKVAQFVDPTQRTTKSSATSPVGGNLDYYWRSLVKKVPGAEATLQPDVNIWGQTSTKDSFGDWALDFANKFILPTNIKVTNRDAVDNELIRVVESTGNADFLPSDGAKYFKVNGETYKMNASQYTQYSQERGQAAYAALKDVMAGASYKTASDEQKAEMLKKALDNAYKQVNNVWKEKLGAYDK